MRSTSTFVGRPAVAQPAWLTARRRNALRMSAGFHLPQGREEAWRYTDVSVLRPDLYPASVRAPGALPERAWAHWAAHHDQPAHAAIADGIPLWTGLTREAAAAGATLMGLEEAALRRPELLRGYLGRLVGAEDLLTAQSLAHFRGGLLLHVPRGVRLSEPLRVQHWIGAPSSLIRPRLLLVLEEDARLTLSEDLGGEDLSAHSLVTPVTEIYLGAAARLTWRSWQQLGLGIRHLATAAVRLERDARLISFHASFGADLSRMNLRVSHAGEGAESELLGAYFPAGEQHMEQWTVQELDAPHTRSELLYKGAISGSGYGLYYGTIRVGPRARMTDSRQTNRNILLSKEARADSNPQLEISTGNVRCAHGSSAGPIPEEQLHYAMTRGISRQDAERMLVTGFLAEVADRLHPDVGRRLREMVGQKLREEMA